MDENSLGTDEQLLLWTNRLIEGMEAEIKRVSKDLHHAKLGLKLMKRQRESLKEAIGAGKAFQ